MRDDEGEPFDHAATAERLARELDERGAGHMDPPDEVYWRDVAVELRRRAIRAV